jgi:hypothetical protein
VILNEGSSKANATQLKLKMKPLLEKQALLEKPARRN